MTEQQKQALLYFNNKAADWNRQANIQSNAQVNIIKQRNNYVLQNIENEGHIENFLDLGCGSGNLVCEVSKKNINAVGVDFSSEMISLAKKNAENLLKNKPQFICDSVFDFNMGIEKYDTISGNGLIEYISYDELLRLLGITFNALKPNGKLIFGSRNRLFNLVSFNEFTTDELESNDIKLLIKESIKITNSKSIDEIRENKNIINTKNIEKQKNTGIDVAIRYQYTPCQLLNIMESVGYMVDDLYPIHIHGISPSLKQQYPQLHVSISNLLQSYANSNYSLIPFSSSFMISARKVNNE